jgi:Zn-dependent protease with chaperone function
MILCLPIFYRKAADKHMAKWIMMLGAILLVIGAILHFAPWLLNWFGKLPGDIRIESERGKIFIPITSMLIVSIVLTILINLFKRF